MNACSKFSIPVVVYIQGFEFSANIETSNLNLGREFKTEVYWQVKDGKLTWKSGEKHFTIPFVEEGGKILVDLETFYKLSGTMVGEILLKRGKGLDEEAVFAGGGFGQNRWNSKVSPKVIVGAVLASCGLGVKPTIAGHSPANFKSFIRKVDPQ